MKEHAELNEKWVQDRIAEDPSILGLGDLVLKDKERTQPQNSFNNVSPDGLRFLMVSAGDDAPGPEVRVVLNWFEQLKQRVATTR